MKMWILLFNDGTIMTCRVVQPRARDYEEGTRCFELYTNITIGEIADWIMYGYPDVNWLKEIKEF